MLVIDHEHVRGWKLLNGEQRRRYVRGLLCSHCNWRMVPARATSAIMYAVAQYLERFERRRDAP